MRERFEHCESLVGANFASNAVENLRLINKNNNESVHLLFWEMEITRDLG